MIFCKSCNENVVGRHPCPKCGCSETTSEIFLRETGVKVNLVWEQHVDETFTTSKGDWITPVGLLEQVGEEGRECILEVLFINYPTEVRKMYEYLRWSL